MTVPETSRSEALEATADILARISEVLPDDRAAIVHSGLALAWLEGAKVGMTTTTAVLEESLRDAIARAEEMTA